MTVTAKTELGRIFAALSEDIRLKIVRLLTEAGELCVCDLMAALDMGQSRVSFHMAVLKSAGLISSRRVGRWNSYRISDRRPAQNTVIHLIQAGKSININAEKKKLQAYLKMKNMLGPDGRKCCPELLPMRKTP